MKVQMKRRKQRKKGKMQKEHGNDEQDKATRNRRGLET
jgi:hypothetical protein